MSWPPNALPGGTHVLNAYDQILSVQDMVLPDDFTIKLPPDWARDVTGKLLPLNWRVNSMLKFGTNCVIDLSPQVSPPRKPPTARPGADGGMGLNGGDGETGSDGDAGTSGADLHLTLAAWNPAGSLWIRVDGSSGGDGGDGGNGGNGGNGKCDAVGLGGPNGGNGGKGGNGGRGGPGGNTSRVQIDYVALPIGVAPPIASCAPECGSGAYQAPPANNNGSIRVYGAAGCGGRSGHGGVGGRGGNGDNCGWGRRDRQPGQPGDKGLDGHDAGSLQKCFAGPNGKCRVSADDIASTVDANHIPH